MGKYSGCKIGGLQKLTLLDYPEKVACTVFLSGCNLNCPFCHNAGLVTHIDSSLNIKKEELFKFLKSRTGMLDGVTVSGGEPTLMGELCDFISEIKELGYLVKLDTNGTDPKTLQYLIENKLADYVAMDIKNSKEKYKMTVGLEKFDISPIEESVHILMKGNVDFEFRTTLVSPYHTMEDIKSIGEWLCGDEKFYLQHFVNSGDLIGDGVGEIEKAEAEVFLDILRIYVKNAQLRGY